MPLDDAGRSHLLKIRGPGETPAEKGMFAEWEWIEGKNIPPREWLFGRYLQRGILSVTVAPGGLGKTTLGVAETISLGSGKRLFGEWQADPYAPEHKGMNVALWNLEDPFDELDRKIVAACKHHGVTIDDLAQGTDSLPLFVNSGLDMPLLSAAQDLKGFINENVFRQMEDAIRSLSIDVVIIDPFVSSHDLSENDNVQIDRLAKRWAKLAYTCNCAVSLVHHTRKGQDGQMTEESSRGAKALTDAARVVRVLQPMSEHEGQEAGLDEGQHRRFFRILGAKQNLSAPGKDQVWRQIVSVPLGNGDEVGVAEAWAWPDTLQGVEADDLRAIQLAAKGRCFGESSQAADWLGCLVADTLSLDRKTHRRRIAKMIDYWCTVGAFERFSEYDKRAGRDRPMLRVGMINPPSTTPKNWGVETCGGEDV
ncbi:MAG: AAA family ATPase [Pseudomonadota bacterium]